MSEKHELNFARLAAVSAVVSYYAYILPPDSPLGKRTIDRMRKLLPGDMVLEITNMKFWQFPSYNFPAMGRLLGVANEPMKDWDDEEPAPLIDYWYIENIHGQLERWENACFVLVFEDWIDSRREELESQGRIFQYSGDMDRQEWVQEARLRHDLTELSWVSPPYRGGW